MKAKAEVFTQRTRFAAPVSELFQWHARPGALERLSPPWDPVEVVQKSGGIQPGARVVMKVRAAPLPLKLRWVAEHGTLETDRFFEDRQIQGPFARWVHSHRFTPDGPDASFLEDRIEFRLPLDMLSGRVGNRLVRAKLERIFTYRHHTLAHDLQQHLAPGGRRPRHVLLSGASGLVGSALIPFLTTGGHQVTQLVRRPATAAHQVFWDPLAGRLDPGSLQGVDTVVHLSGENIGEGRWTAAKKRRIIASRNESTALIARTLSRLDPPPEVLICASAIGYYGDRGNAWLSEEDACGADFISGVCSEWENAAAPAAEKGIRVVFLRIGIVLSPLGGALSKLLPPFKLGLGGKLGSGTQYMSWIGIDDVLGIIHHAMLNTQLQGPLNVAAPTPVTNLEFTRTLGRVLARPAAFTVPARAIETLWGQMGREVLLSSTRVDPGKLLASGYRFRHARLEPVLAHLLGKPFPGDRGAAP